MMARRFVVAALGWFALACGREAALDRPATVWVDVPELFGAGLPGLVAAASWGSRCRWEGAAFEDRQRFADSCGPAALRAILRRRGLAAPQALLWSVCRLPEGGTTLGRLASVAQRFGHECRLVWDPELENIEPPAIVHLTRGHFVVLEGRWGSCVRIFDPACGRLRVSAATLRRSASGATLVFPAATVPEPCERTPERRVDS